MTDVISRLSASLPIMAVVRSLRETTTSTKSHICSIIYRLVLDPVVWDGYGKKVILSSPDRDASLVLAVE